MSSTRVLVCNPSSIKGDTISDDDTRYALDEAVKDIQAGKVVAFPTETVYGLGANAFSESASKLIFTTKGRPSDNPLIVHISHLNMLKDLLDPRYTTSRAYEILIKKFWPGPMTLLFPRHSVNVPSVITAGQNTIAVRMPSHPIARALISLSGLPIAAPSANSSGKPSPTKAEHVLYDLSGKLGVILDGGTCEVGLESTVVDGMGDAIRILRPGGVTVEQIRAILLQELGESAPKVLVHKRDYEDDAQELNPTTPGMKYRHYSPSVPVTLLCTISSPPSGISSVPMIGFLGSLSADAKIGLLVPIDSSLLVQLQSPTSESQDIQIYHLGSRSSPAVTAARLFDGLLTLERAGVHHILIEEVEETDEGLAIMNRVRKAAGDVVFIKG